MYLLVLYIGTMNIVWDECVACCCITNKWRHKEQAFEFDWTYKRIDDILYGSTVCIIYLLCSCDVDFGWKHFAFFIDLNHELWELNNYISR